MASLALRDWETARAARLDEIEAAYGAFRRQRALRRQIVHAYALFLASEFQGFCRTLHSESAARIRRHAVGRLGGIIERALSENRKLDRGNATLANIAADFDRFEISVAGALAASDPSFAKVRAALDGLGAWRNAIAHDDFTHRVLAGRRQLSILEVRRFRRACDAFAQRLDELVDASVGPLVADLSR